MQFSLRNVDQKFLSLDDFPQAQGFIIVFTCNHCPYAIAYEDRLKELDEEFTPQGYPLIAINPNDPAQYPQDSFENMQIRARDKGFGFPYVFDETQEIATTYGAQRTPHVFVLLKGSDGLKKVYEGAIDDNYQSAHLVQKAYLAEFMRALIQTGEATPMKTMPVGCTIKWKQAW
ncbi:MAG: thioredoxin family protein [Bacteroidota bacterium]